MTSERRSTGTRNLPEAKSTTSPTPQPFSSTDTAATVTGVDDADAPISQVARYNVSRFLLFFLRYVDILIVPNSMFYAKYSTMMFTASKLAHTYAVVDGTTTRTISASAIATTLAAD